MAEWPKRYHPARYLNGQHITDTTTTAEGYQLRPDTWRDLAVWCGGVRHLDDNGNQGVRIGHVDARLGEFVMRRNGIFTVEPADGHYQRWSLA